MKVFNKKGFAALAAAALLAAACGGGSSTSKELIIGISLPLSGSALASAGPAQKGAELAVSEVTLEGGYTLKTIALDHAVNGLGGEDDVVAQGAAGRKVGHDGGGAKDSDGDGD